MGPGLDPDTGASWHRFWTRLHALEIDHSFPIRNDEWSRLWLDKIWLDKIWLDKILYPLLSHLHSLPHQDV